VLKNCVPGVNCTPIMSFVANADVVFKVRVIPAPPIVWLSPEDPEL
jgi:hypothetical protein